MQSYIWLGVRESEIADTKGLFTGSVTIFGTGKGENHAMECDLNKRLDHNGSCPEYDSYFQNKMRQILEEDPAIRFIPYDASDFAGCPLDLQEKLIFCNDQELLNRINNKIILKQDLKTIVPVLPYILLQEKECTSDKLQSIFPSAQAAVVQRAYSYGGSGTSLVPFSGGALKNDLLQNDEICMVTAFQEHSISVNIHCVLYSDEFVLFPPSLQIIDQSSGRLEYIGSDYSAYQLLSDAEQRLVRETATSVCQWLRQQGYLGVCGIDLLLTDSACYFMEVNPRFQASTALLNHYLVQNGLPCLQEYHQDSFCSPVCTLQFPIATAAGSVITLHYRESEREQLMWLWNAVKSVSGVQMCDDGLSWDRPTEDNCCLFQIYCSSALSCVTFQRNLRLHPNVTISPFRITSDCTFDNLLRLKLLLLSRGTSITSEAWLAARQLGGFDWKEFDAITLCIDKKVWITAPCTETWHELSPVQIDADPATNTFFLRYYGQKLMPVDIMQEDPRANKKTEKGHLYQDIVYLNPDRLRIYHRDGCIFKDSDTGCQFCDLCGTGTPISFDEIREVMEAYWEDFRIEHYLIGGGSGPLSDEVQNVIRLSGYLSRHDNKHIYLMTQPIEDIEVLKKMRSNGITEVAFNIEVFDRNIAQRIMPGKSSYTVSRYLRALQNAVSVFGASGEVRSAVLVGIDDLPTFKSGIRQLCKIGVSPILSLFRPCKETPLEYYMPADESFALSCFEAAISICNEFSVRLGPTCKACQNNVIALELD